MDVILIPLLEVARFVISAYSWIIIAQAILSWLVAFQIINPDHQFVYRIGNALYALTEPLLRPLRRFLPSLGTVDIAPVVLLLALWFLDGVLARLIFSF